MEHFIEFSVWRSISKADLYDNCILVGFIGGRDIGFPSGFFFSKTAIANLDFHMLLESMFDNIKEW